MYLGHFFPSDAVPLRSKDPQIKHFGPMTQNFHELHSEEGGDDRRIPAVNAEEVALSAIKGLHELLMEKARRYGHCKGV